MQCIQQKCTFAPSNIQYPIHPKFPIVFGGLRRIAISTGNPLRILCQLLISCHHSPHQTASHTLAHHNTAHENFNGPDSLKRDLALAGRLVQSQSGTELILADGLRVVNLVSENKEGNLSKLLHAQKCIKLSLGFKETLVIFSINKEDNSGDFREVVLPEATSLLMATKIEGSEFNVTDRKLFRGCRGRFRYAGRCWDEMKNDLLGCKVGCKIATRSFYMSTQSAS